MNQCPKCLHKFTDRQALCVDWRDPTKAFAGPNCKTFYIRDMRPSVNAGLIGGLLGGGVAIPLMSLLLNGFCEDNWTNVALSFVAVVSVIALFLLVNPTEKALIKSPYHPDTWVEP